MMGATLLGLRVLCVGCSLTASAPGSWESYCDQSEHDTVNAGVAGATGGYWLGHFDDIADLVFDRTVSFTAGVNDVAFDVSPTSFEFQLNTLVQLFADAGANDIVLHVPPYRQGDLSNILDFGLTGATLNARLDTLIPIIFKVAAEQPTARIGTDWRTLPLEYPEAWWDQTHPNSLGHSIAAVAIDASLVEPVPEPGTASLRGVGLICLAGARRVSRRPRPIFARAAR